MIGRRRLLVELLTASCLSAGGWVFRKRHFAPVVMSFSLLLYLSWLTSVFEAPLIQPNAEHSQFSTHRLQLYCWVVTMLGNRRYKSAVTAPQWKFLV